MTHIDFGRHSDDYAEYRPGFPPSFYQRLNGLFRIKDSCSLDLATGPGIIALELAALGSETTGIDISPELIARAEERAHEKRLQDLTTFQVARAEETGLKSTSFDIVTAGQCWHWFESAVVMKEIQRVLRPGGMMVIAYYSYLADHVPLARETEALILSFNPQWSMGGSSGMYPELIEDVLKGGFLLKEQFCYHHEEPFSHTRWRGRMRTCNGVGSGALSPEDVQQFDDALSRLLEERFPNPVSVTHRIWCLVAEKPVGITND